LTESVTGTVAATTTVSTPDVTSNYTHGNTDSVQTLTLTCAQCVWQQETAAGLFTVAGGTGASIGTPTVSSNTSCTVALTAGTAVAILTVTDTSTGKSFVFATTPNNITTGGVARLTAPKRGEVRAW